MRDEERLCVGGGVGDGSVGEHLHHAEDVRVARELAFCLKQKNISD